MIFSFEWNQREGKSAAMVGFAWYLGSITNYPKICANFHIYGYPGQFQYFKEWAELDEPSNALILYDEIGKTHDARLFNSKDQIRFTHFFSEMGKRGNTLIYSAQRDFLVEKRVREQTDIVVQCWKDWVSGALYQIWWDARRSRDFATLLGRYRFMPGDVFEHYNSYEVIANEEHFNDQIQKNFKR